MLLKKQQLKGDILNNTDWLQKLRNVWFIGIFLIGAIGFLTVVIRD